MRAGRGECELLHQANRGAPVSAPFADDHDAAKLEAEMRVPQAGEDDEAYRLSVGGRLHDEMRQIGITECGGVLLAVPRQNERPRIAVLLGADDEIDVVGGRATQADRIAHWPYRPRRTLLRTRVLPLPDQRAEIHHDALRPQLPIAVEAIEADRAQLERSPGGGKAEKLTDVSAEQSLLGHDLVVGEVLALDDHVQIAEGARSRRPSEIAVRPSNAVVI